LLANNFRMTISMWHCSENIKSRKSPKGNFRFSEVVSSEMDWAESVINRELFFILRGSEGLIWICSNSMMRAILRIRASSNSLRNWETAHITQPLLLSLVSDLCRNQTHQKKNFYTLCEFDVIRLFENSSSLLQNLPKLWLEYHWKGFHSGVNSLHIFMFLSRVRFICVQQR